MEGSCLGGSPHPGPLEALLLLGRAQAEMASIMVNGWLAAQAELAAFFWRAPAAPPPPERDERIDERLAEAVASAMHAATGRFAALEAAQDGDRAAVALAPLVLAHCPRCRADQPVHEAPPPFAASALIVRGGACGVCGAFLLPTALN